MPDPAPTPAPRQRIDGTLHHNLPATLAIRALPDGQEDDGLLRLRLSVTSETPLPHYDWNTCETVLYVLGHGTDEVDLARLNDGAPVLANHDRYQAVGATPLAGIGGVERAWTEDGRIMADLIISRREALADLRQDIADGLVRNVSIGAQIHARVLTVAVEGQMKEYRVISWTPFEVSLVDVPLDASVGLGRAAEDPRSPAAQPALPAPHYSVVNLPAEGSATHLPKGERSMPEITVPAAATTPATPTPAPAAPESSRATPVVPVTAIREAVRVAGYESDLALDMIERGLSIEAAREELFRKMAENVNANPTRSASADIVTLRDETEVRRELMAEAIAHRMAPTAKISDGAREYRHMSLLRMSEESLHAAGIRTKGLAGREIVARAMHGTSDFPLILANVANKRLRSAYEAAPTTYQIWARRAPNAPDFKNISIAQLGGAPDLQAVAENGEFQYGTIGEGAESYKVVTYGRIVAFNRQAIINDDLRAFDRLITAFAGSARRLENRLVYQQLTANANMADGVALFHATHGNLAGAGAAIGATTLGAGRAAMRGQKGLASEELNITPAYLLVPAAQEQLAYQYTSTQFVPAKSSDVNEFRQGGRTALEPIVDPYLDASSTTAWYLAGDGVACDTVEYCWLDGAEGVYIESEMGFDVDGMKLKARLDFGAKVADHRALFKNAGA